MRLDAGIELVVDRANAQIAFEFLKRLFDLGELDVPVYSLGNFVFDGFTTAANNTGWLLRLELDREGASAWRADLVHLDGQGIPHPVPAEGACWEGGQAEPAPCGAP